MSNPRNKKRAGASASAHKILLDAKRKEIEHAKKLNSEAARVKKVEYEPIPVLKKVEENKVETPSFTTEFKQSVIEQPKVDYTSIPALKNHAVPNMSGMNYTQEFYDKFGSHDVDFTSELAEMKKKKELGLGYYSDAEIQKMYQDAQAKKSEYGGLARLFNDDAKDAYNEYNALHNEISRRDTNAKAQIMNERNAYDDIVSLGRLRLVYDDETGQPILYDEGLKRDYANITASLKNKGYTDEEIREMNDFAYQVADGDILQKEKEFADEHPVVGSVRSLLPNQLKPIDYLRRGVVYASGEPIENKDYSFSDMTQASREGASANMGDVGKFFYNTGMSMADSLVSRGMTGNLSPVLMGMGTAEDTTKDAIDRGADATDALATGAGAGLTEALFEKMELDKLNAFKQVPGTGVKNFLGNVGKQMVSEGVSEGATEFVNTLTDYFINGDNSNFSLAVDAYESQGLTHDEAMDAAIADVAKNVGLNALGGAFSGGVMGAGYQMAGLNNNPGSLNPLEGQQNVSESSEVTLNPLESQNKAVEEITSTTKTLSQFERSQKAYNENVINGNEAIQNASLMRTIKDKANIFLRKAFSGKGKTDEPYNQVRLSSVPDNIAENVKTASGGKLDISGKIFALEGGKLKHEIEQHSDPVIEASRDQIALNANDISNVVDTMYHPDFVEYISSGLKSNQRESFALIKADEGYIVVVENVGGKQNPNIVAEEILHLTNHKMEQFLNGEKSIADILYENSKRKGDAESNNEDKKNRVTVAHDALNNEPSAYTSETFPHSPLSSDSIPVLQKNVNGTDYNTKKIDGFTDLNKQLDKFVGMYKGDENTQSNFEAMKSAINEYLHTGNQDAIDRALVLADTIDESLKGHSYTYKGSGKNSVKAQNRKQSVTYNEGDFTNAILDYSRELRDTAVSNAEGLEPLAYQKQSDYKVMSEDVGLNNTTSSPVAEAEFNVRGYNTSIAEKSDMPESVKNEFINNPQFYQVLKNKDTEAAADQIISEKGIDEAKAEFDSLVDKKEPVAIPLGYKIASQYQKDGRVNEAVEILRKMSEKLTESGQFSQAAAITLMNNDPTTALQYITREFDKLNASGKEKYKNKWKDFELTEDEKALFSNLEPGDTDGIKNAYETIYKRFRKEYPSTLMEKLVEARRIGMLLNVRTNVRNVVSNALLQPVRWSTDRVSALGQNAIKLINPDFNTTQAIYVGKKAKKLSDEAWNSVKDSILNEETSRYNDTQKAIRDKQVFKGTKASQFIDTVTGGAITKLNKVLGKDVNPSVMETARNLTYWLLEKGDNVFVANNFKSRMASYIQAQGITDLENIPADAYSLAAQEALKATFKDENGLTRALSSVKKNSGMLGEVILPFTKTPANLAMRGIDYSPAGVISTFKQFEKSNRTQADVSQFMDNISKQVVGTAAIALGYALAKAGFISGELSEDKDEAAFQKQQGQLSYAIHIGQNYYTYDWAQPASIPLIFGATIYQATNESDNQLNAILQGVTAATDAWFNLSPLQNVQEIFGGYGTPAENLRDTIMDIPTSFVPAQLGAGARIVDPVQRQAFSNGDTLGTLKNNIIAKIPVLSKTLPAAYDTWGNEVKRSNSTGEAAFAQLLNPGQLGNAAVTPIDGEIQRLYDETGEKGVFPKKAAWSYKVNGEQVALDNEMYSQMQKLTGNTSYDIASEFINNSEYDSLSDESKASVLSDIYSFSDAIGKSELLGYDIEDSDYAKQYNIYKESGAEGLANYLAINQSVSASGSSMSDKIPTLKQMDLTDAERGEFLRNNNSRPSDGAMTAYDDYGDKGFYWYYLCKIESDANGNGSMSQKELEAYLKSSSFTKQQKEYYWNLFYPKAKKKPSF